MQTLEPYQRWEKEDLAAVRLSEFSSWNDDTWSFKGSTAGQRRGRSLINWRFTLPNGSLSTDPCNAQLLEAWKRIVWRLYADPGDGLRRKWENLSTISGSIRYLTRWMVKNDLTHVTALTPGLVADYLDDLTMDKTRGGKDDDGLTSLSLAKYIQVLDYIWWARDDLVALGFPPMTAHPLAGKTVPSICNQLTKKVIGSIPALEDNEFIAVVNAAWEYIETSAEVLVYANNEMASHRTRNATTPQGNLKKFVQKSVRQLAQSVESGINLNALRQRIDDLRTACAIIIQATTGMRVSELVGLEVNQYTGTQSLPDCVEVKRTEDDYYEIFLLRGWLYKGALPRKETRWVAGLRPTGSDYLPPPVQAARILAALDDGWRRDLECKTLYLNFPFTRGFPIQKSNSVAGATTGLASRHQKTWIKQRVGLQTRFTTHMWRKTFAQYMVRTAPGMLPLISDHFKHLTQAVTEHGYLNAKTGDQELNDLVRAERARFAAKVMAEIATGQRAVVGPKAQWLNQEVSTILKRLDNRSSQDRAVDIEEIVRENGFKLWDSDWGYCVFAPEGAKCHRKNGVLGAWARRTPNFAERSPPRCVECPHFAVAPEHEPFWRQRLEENRTKWEACKDDQKTSPVVAAQFRERLRQAEIVLTWIEKEKHHAA
jgi:integrase